MKKSYLNFLLVLLCLGISSCEKENLNAIGQIEESPNASLSRSSSDFDPLSELQANDVVVYIKNKGEGDAYLSTGTDDYSLTMKSGDDGSGRQRWLLNSMGIFSVYPQEYVLGLGGTGSDKPCVAPYIFGNTLVANMVAISQSQNYDIKISVPIIGGGSGGIMPGPMFETKYLQRKSSSSNDLIYGDSNVHDWTKWEIVPYGSYTIEDIEYALYDGGSLDSSSVVVDQFEVDNSKSAVPIKRSKTVTTTVEETSTFSSTEGVSTSSSVSSSTSVGLPAVEGVSINMGTSISTSNTNTSSFTQGETKRTTRTITETYEVEVPAYTYYKLDVIMKSYSMNLRYIATLRGEDGTTFRVKGTWKGVQATGTYLKPISQGAEDVKYIKRTIE